MAIPNWANRTLWTGDNLDIMRGMNSESVDLIYLDPPFNSNKNYAAPIGSEAAGAAFKDTWTLDDVDEAWHGEIADQDPTLYAIIDAAGYAHGKGMKSYLIMMAVRLMEMRRILKDTGSIYLHRDPTASHYLKTLMDAIFGAGNFRSDIVWKRSSAHSDTRRDGSSTDAFTTRCCFTPGAITGRGTRNTLATIRTTLTGSIGTKIATPAAGSDLAISQVRAEPPRAILATRSWALHDTGGTQERRCRNSLMLDASFRQVLGVFPRTSVISMKCRAYPYKTCGLTFDRLGRRPRSALGIPHRSRWPYWSASSRSVPTRDRSSWIPSAVAPLPVSQRKSWNASG